MNHEKILTPLFLFAAASLFIGIYSGLYEPSFNNYLAQVHQLDAVARGALEFPRELPGFLIVFIFALLAFLPDTRIAMFAAFLVCISLLGQAYLAPEMNWVIVWMLIWSTGAHLYMTLKNSICLRLADRGHEGRLLGAIGALESVGILLGMGVVYWGATHLNISFSVIFLIAGICALLASFSMLLIKPIPLKRPEKYLLIKRKYSLFYLLNILFGARKQIFLTFAPWVLIKMFSCVIETFAFLGIIGTVISLVFRPLLGRAIDSWGEKIVISIESVLLIIICVLYGMSPLWFPARIALIIIMVCYVADQLLFSVNIARATYLNRIADSQSDIAPSLSMGVTLDHGVSMLVPVAGGFLWAYTGPQWVFLAAAFIAILNLISALFIPDLDRSLYNTDIETVE